MICGMLLLDIWQVVFMVFLMVLYVSSDGGTDGAFPWNHSLSYDVQGLGVNVSVI